MKTVIQNLKGFRDFLPNEARKRAWLKSQMVKVFEKWGYEPMETPTLEPLELFEGQIGEDEKLFYKFKDQGDRWVAMRYDQTVPTCRVLGQNFDKIVFPFRRYQIQTAYRAEKPQKGRYREFTQADIDLYGIDSPIADAECIAVGIDLYKTLGFKNVIAIINNRDLLKDIPYPVIAAIDKIRKIGKEAVTSEIISKGYKQEEAENFLQTIENLKPDDKIQTIFNYLEKIGIPGENYKFDPTLVRSFSYSEGPIWEIVIPEYEAASFAGSVGGGERYDTLIEKITGKKIPGTGIAFGFDRTLDALEIQGLIPNQGTITKVLVTVFSPDLYWDSLKYCVKLRQTGVNCELYPDPSAKLEKQLKYADKKGIPFAIILGPEEIKSDTVSIKNLKSQTQKKVFSNSVAALLND
jgi:histidyl-tRNA synthetase